MGFENYSGVKVALVGFGGIPSSSSVKLMDYVFNTFRLIPSDTPDIVFVREDLYSIREMLTNFSSNTTRVLFAGEMQGANFDLFDYVIGWEIGDFAGRYVRMHPALREWRILQLASNFSSAIPMNQRNFCDFIFSNGKHFGPRDDFFQTLNQLRSVDSLGPHLRNAESFEELKPFGPGWELEKIKRQSRYKFSISIENGIYGGYTTEKIITSVIAGSIPIYWGNPQVAIDFNPERLINLDQFDSLETAAKYVCELAENETELERIVNLPLMTNAQLLRVRESEFEIVTMLEKIIETATSGRLLRPRGTSVAQREAIFVSALSKNCMLDELRKLRARDFFSIRRFVPPKIRRFFRYIIRQYIHE